MDKPLSRSGDQAVQLFLDRADVLRGTMAQLCKDLSLSDDGLKEPPSPEEAFELLSEQVLSALEVINSLGEHSLKVAMYRVDIAEPHLRRTLAAGGLDALSKEVVLRALQKVLTRLRFAGRF